LSLPLHPRGAWFVASRRRPTPEPISWLDYLDAINRLPQTSIEEAREAEHVPGVAAILACRDEQRDELRGRWLMHK